jgi:hypothetical protein
VAGILKSCPKLTNLILILNKLLKYFLKSQQNHFFVITDRNYYLGIFVNFNQTSVNLVIIIIRQNIVVSVNVFSDLASDQRSVETHALTTGTINWREI